MTDKPSKLDELLDEVGFWDKRTDIEAAHQEQTKQQIKALVLELIGEDAVLPDAPDANSKQWRIANQRWACNQMKAELRQKVEAL